MTHSDRSRQKSPLRSAESLDDSPGDVGKGVENPSRWKRRKVPKRPQGSASRVRGLSDRHRLFAEGIARGERGIDAAKAAGFLGNDKTLTETASRLQLRPDIQAHLAMLRAKATSTAVLDLQERLVMLSNIASGGDVDHVLKDGTTVKAPASARDRIAAIAEVGKLKGDYVKKVEHTGAVKTLVELIDELDEKRAAEAAKVAS